MSVSLLHFMTIQYAALSCAAVGCGDPGTPTNGQRSLSSTTYNSVVTYTCDVRYTLQGMNNRTCQSNGQWSGSLPQCNCTLNDTCVPSSRRKWKEFGGSCICKNIMIMSTSHSCAAVCSSPCQNGGTCTGPDTCSCDVGWMGLQCETGV